MIDLESDDFAGNQERLDWLKDVRRANIKQDCADYRQYRLFGNAFMVGDHRVEFFSSKKQAKTSFTALCPKLNPDTCKYDRMYTDGPKAGTPVSCPMCDDLGQKPSDRYLVHAIDRTLQQRGDSNPVVVLRLPASVMFVLWNKRQFNKVNGKPYSPAHSDYGFDIYLKFNPALDPQKMYSVETGNQQHTPLTDVERAYKQYDLVTLYKNVGLRQADPDALRTSLERIGKLESRHGTTSIPTHGFGGSDDDLPASYGGPSFGSGSFTANTPVQGSPGFVPPTQATTGFVPPTQMPSGAGFTPPTAPADPSPRFSGPPTQQQQAAAPAAATISEKPECFGVESEMGSPKCTKCPVKKACFSGT